MPHQKKVSKITYTYIHKKLCDIIKNTNTILFTCELFYTKAARKM